LSLSVGESLGRVKRRSAVATGCPDGLLCTLVVALPGERQRQWWLSGDALVELEGRGGLLQAGSRPVDECCGAPVTAIWTAASVGLNAGLRLRAMSAAGRQRPLAPWNWSPLSWRSTPTPDSSPSRPRATGHQPPATSSSGYRAGCRKVLSRWMNLFRVSRQWGGV